jgi:hypothetical protein
MDETGTEALVSEIKEDNIARTGCESRRKLYCSNCGSNYCVWENKPGP